VNIEPATGVRYRTVLRWLLAGVLVASLGFAFVQLGSEAIEGETDGLDTRILVGAQSLRAAHPGLTAVMRDVSALGGTTVLSLVTTVAAAYLALASAWKTAVCLGASVITGSILVTSFKTAFGRARPPSAFADTVVAGLSYPSGHASVGAIVYLALGALVAARLSRGSERSFVLVAATLITLFVGASRAVLGLHWATDVLGGWAFGAAWALLWLLLDRWWRQPRSGALTRPGP
jgi:undecaprenyl-diphosphatase